MDEQPLVSILTRTYNQGAFLAVVIETVLSQDYSVCSCPGYR